MGVQIAGLVMRDVRCLDAVVPSRGNYCGRRTAPYQLMSELSTSPLFWFPLPCRLLQKLQPQVVALARAVKIMIQLTDSSPAPAAT
jgi:hypothetical protein